MLHNIDKGMVIAMNENSKLFEQLPKGAISEIIIQRITDALISGELKPGDKLPTELEFSEKLKIGRNSVREAIKVLVAFGVLEIRRSEGTYVVEKFSQNLLNPIVYGVILANESSESLLEFKATFLNSILYLAVQKATDEEIRCLRNQYGDFHAAMHECPTDVEKNYNISKDFYSYLGQITKNPLLIQLNEVVLKISKFSRMKAIQVSIDTDSRDCLLNSYFKMLEIIEKRDKNGISAVSDYVFEVWQKLLL